MSKRTNSCSLVTSTRYTYCVLSILILFLSLSIQAQDQNANDKLDEVKQAIEAKKSNIKQVAEERKKLVAKLKQDELAISSSAKSLLRTREQLNDTQASLVKLTKEKKQLVKQKQTQETILAKQLRAAYSSGHHDYLKLILNQENPGTVQRTITYYQYLNDARIKEITTFEQTIARLSAIEEEQVEKQSQLTTLKDQQQKEKLALEKGKSAREKTVKALNNRLLTSTQQLEKLEVEEASLVEALKRITKLSKQDFSLNGLAKLKSKLNWPVKGKISRSFGSRKQGYLKWKGVLLSAPLGRTISTIHNGVVLFSDWLKGYGLVTVIDHGNGYMSLYGHNQALLKSVGDRVETGEPIALVGQSGGQDQPALYFEIRHQGQAVNPKQWCR